MIALSILVFSFLGLWGLLARSYAITRIVSDDYIGTYLAAEGIEIVKNLIDYNVNGTMYAAAGKDTHIRVYDEV